MSKADLFLTLSVLKSASENNPEAPNWFFSTNQIWSLLKISLLSNETSWTAQISWALLLLNLWKKSISRKVKWRCNLESSSSMINTLPFFKVSYHGPSRYKSFLVPSDSCLSKLNGTVSTNKLFSSYFLWKVISWSLLGCLDCIFWMLVSRLIISSSFSFSLNVSKSISSTSSSVVERFAISKYFMKCKTQCRNCLSDFNLSMVYLLCPRSWIPLTKLNFLNQI